MPGKLLEYMTPESGLLWSHIGAVVAGTLVLVSTFCAFYFQRQIDNDLTARRDSQHQELATKLDQIITNSNADERVRNALTQRLLASERTREDDLKQRFEFGYAMLKVAGGDFFFVPRNVQPEVDWMSTRIVNINNEKVTIRLPEVRDDKNNRLSNLSLQIPRRPGFSIPLFGSKDYLMIIEVLENAVEDVTLVVGFKKKPPQEPVA